MSTGFSRKSAAPSFIAATAASTEPKPVSTTTGGGGVRARASASTSRPLPSGSIRSVSTRSIGPPAANSVRAAARSPAAATA